MTGFQGPGLTSRQSQSGTDSFWNFQVNAEPAAAKTPLAGSQTMWGL